MKDPDLPLRIASRCSTQWRGLLRALPVLFLLAEPIDAQQPESTGDRGLTSAAGIGIGVISTGAVSLAAGNGPEDLLDQVAVLPGQAGEGDGGTEVLALLRELAPGAELYFATGLGGPARFAANVEALCQAGADVIVDDIFDFQRTIHQGGLMAQGIARTARDGCVYVSAVRDLTEPGALPAGGACVTAATPDYSTQCGQSNTPIEAAAWASRILGKAGGRHQASMEELRAAVGGAAFPIEPLATAVEDTPPPEVGRIQITSNPPDGREVYAIGDSIEVTVTFGEAVYVSGTPQLSLEVGNVTRLAGYSGGMGTSALMFSYTVTEGDEDADGLSLQSDSLSLGDGMIEDGSGNPAELGHAELGDQAGQRVDGVRPSLVTGGEATVAGARLSLMYDEPLAGSSTPTAGDFMVTVAGEERDVTTVAVAGSRVVVKLASPVGQGEPVTVSYSGSTVRMAETIRDPAGNESEAFSNQAVTNRTGPAPDPAGRKLSAKTVKQIQAILAAKARRTPAQKKVSSELLDARRMAGALVASDKAGSRSAPDADPLNEPVKVDIRADVTPQVLKRIRTLGGTVINSFPTYRAIRAWLPLDAVEALAELEAVKSIRTADKAFTRGSVKRRLEDGRPRRGRRTFR